MAGRGNDGPELIDVANGIGHDQNQSGIEPPAFICIQAMVRGDERLIEIIALLSKAIMCNINHGLSPMRR